MNGVPVVELLTTTALPAALITAFTFSLFIIVKSIINFTQTGPQVRDEILKRYSLYSVYAFARISFWTFIISFWLSFIGSFTYLCFAISSNHDISLIATVYAAFTSLIILTCVQFCHHLIHIPGCIMMSSSYSMVRMIPLWNLLSVSRLRWLQLFIIGIVLYGFCNALVYLYGHGDNELFFLLLVAFVIVSPVVLAFLPERCKKSSQTRHTAPQSPNILMIGCDTLRADRLGILGYKRNLTPFLDTLSSKGNVFSNCFTPLARTAPSLTSLFTGMWPHTHGIRSNFCDDESSRITVHKLPKILSQHGYKTSAIADWAGSDLCKVDFGFNKCDVPFDQWNLKFLIRQGPKDIRLFLSLFTHNRFGKLFLPELYYLAGTPLTRQLGRSTRKQISRFAADNTPFLLNVFMATTHPPFGSEYPYYRLFSDKSYKGESMFGMSRVTDPFEIIRSQKEPREAFDLEQIVDLYDGCVRNFDDEVRKIVHHLNKCGLSDNTIIVIYSDHGMDLFEHDTWGQGNSAVGNSGHVPMIIYDPRKAGHGVDKRIIRTIDIMPTLMELTGIDIPANIDGTSIVSYLDNSDVDMKLDAFFETGIWLTTPPGTHPQHITYPDILDLLDTPDISTGTLAIKPEYKDITIKARDRMLRAGKWKLVCFPLQGGFKYQLFDTENDPECKNNLANSNPDVTASMKDKLDAWIYASNIAAKT